MKPAESLLKMHFVLERDEVGWPPVDSESVWVKQIGRNLFSLENVPFFARLVAFQDQLEGAQSENVIWFRRNVKSSGYATVRVICTAGEKKEELIRTLEGLECQIEGASQWNLLAIGIPPGQNFDSAMAVIREGQKKEWWDYEESCLPPKPRKPFWRW